MSYDLPPDPPNRTGKTPAKTAPAKRPPTRQVRRRLARVLANDILAGRVKLA